ncbi:MAG: dihydroxyacetone kinase subunit DhaL [Halanaerobium sp.]
MAENISVEKIKKALIKVADKLKEERRYFNKLDAPIGDSDHGDSVSKAFQKVKEIIVDSEADIGKLLKDAGFSISSLGGGAMGPLYGTAFMEAGRAVSGKNSITYQELVDMWLNFAEGIQKRGEVKLGDKTMYDTIKPAVDELEKAYKNEKNLEEAVKLTIEAAEKGMNSTKDMLSKKGRSSRLGKRTKGHIDPGAASMYTIISTFFKEIIN